MREKYYTLEEVAHLLKVGRMTVYRWVWAGKLQAVRIGRMWRVPHDALEAFLKQGEGKDGEGDSGSGR